jgi:3'(2'), 5'-bisphosphate nucleotidase
MFETVLPDRSPPPFEFCAQPRDAIAVALARAALEAGPAVMEEYARGSATRSKADGSPVTLADERAEAIIRARLSALAPATPIVAEEAAAAGAPLDVGTRFFLVDPLDGTKDFISRNGEFTINVALIEAGAPVAGAVYAPAQDRLWFAGATAYVCEAPLGGELPAATAWRKLRTRAAPAGLIALASRSHGDPDTEAFLARLPISERKSAGSSLKFCVIAEGGADVYPRFAPTMEWDTAAGDAVLRAAGGIVLRADGAPLDYGKIGAGLRNGGFVAYGDFRLAARCAVA